VTVPLTRFEAHQQPLARALKQLRRPTVVSVWTETPRWPSMVDWLSMVLGRLEAHLPGRPHMASAGQETVFAGEGNFRRAGRTRRSLPLAQFSRAIEQVRRTLQPIATATKGHPKQVMQELARCNLIRPVTTQEHIGRCIGRQDSLRRPDHFRRFWRSLFNNDIQLLHFIAKSARLRRLARL
jgi:hypothetical protein